MDYYLSDRFYLNASPFIVDRTPSQVTQTNRVSASAASNTSSPSTSTTSTSIDSPSSPSSPLSSPYPIFSPSPSPPPSTSSSSSSSIPTAEYSKTFNRSAYIEAVHRSEENIQCVILSTYRLDWTFVQEEFPLLFNKNLAIPCLVLHGEKRDEEKKMWSHFDPTSKVGNVQQNDDEEIREEDGDLDVSWSSSLPSNGEVIDANSNMKVLEVAPQWDIPKNICSGRSRFIAGVHHPKYMLIFTDTGLHVCISTANLTKNGSVDATWTQYFPRLSAVDNSIQRPNGDFGAVLEDFLEKQSSQLRECNFDILEWISNTVHISDFKNAYTFDDAKATLVSTVPCRIPLPDLSEEEKCWIYKHYQFDMDLISPQPCEKCKLESCKLSLPTNQSYGSLKMKSILKNAGIEPLLSQSDILLLQPTSIGLGIDNTFMSTFLEHFLPEQSWDENFEFLRQESWRLIWPSRQAMIDIYHSSRQSAEVDIDESIPQYAQGLLFLHARNFSLMEPDIQSQFFSYSPSQAPAVSSLSQKHVPHIKSYCRVSRDSSLCEQDCKCYSLPWASITSACLSRGTFQFAKGVDALFYVQQGAQGICVPYSVCSKCRHLRKGYWDYKNFELGVVFVSDSSHEYKGLNQKCSRHGTSISADIESSNSKLVILPFPFDLMDSSVPFCDEVGKMKLDLFFHPPSPNITSKYPAICTEELKATNKFKRAQTFGGVTSGPIVAESLLGKRSFSITSVLSSKFQKEFDSNKSEKITSSNNNRKLITSTSSLQHLSTSMSYARQIISPVVTPLYNIPKDQCQTESIVDFMC